MRVITTTITDRASARTSERVDNAADHLYDAECAFHDACQTHVDAWIKAASEKLHDAIATHLAAIAGIPDIAASSCSSTTGLNR